MDKLEKQKLDKLDELLSLRESKKDSLRGLNRTIRQGLEQIEGFPSRWYVRNPKENVLVYLSSKYGKTVHSIPECGFGELHGQFAFVPHDVAYSWEITQEEADFLLSKNTLVK